MYIFNFHHVEPDPKHINRKHITITPQGLRSVIRTLRKFKMRPICLRNLLHQPQSELFVSRNDVILTFDDGYENFYEYAVPVLQEENCPATVFVVAGRFSGTNQWDQGNIPVEERDQLMSLERIQALQDVPLVSIGSHGMDHRLYPYLSKEELEWEINESYRLLSEKVPKTFVPVIAYPWGAYTPEAIDIMARSAYRLGVTVEKGIWTPRTRPYEVPRYSVYFRDGDSSIFTAKLLRYRMANLFKRY